MPKSIVFLLLFATWTQAQITNPFYADSLSAHFQTSLQLELAGSPIDSPGIGFQINAPAPSARVPHFYDPKSIMPQNSLFLDYRSGSYYVPRQVNDQIAHIMNRPSADSFVPILAVAYLAARIALQAVQIKKMIRIKPEDYLMPAERFAVLLALWKHSPQTAIELYRQPELQHKRTFKLLENELAQLVDSKLVKIKKQEKAPTLYFASQKEEIARKMLLRAVADETWTENKKNEAKELLTRMTH